MIFQVKWINKFLYVKPNICGFPFQRQFVFQQLKPNANNCEKFNLL